MAALPQPGDTITEKYEVVRYLGKGGYGVVVEARHKKLDQRFAIKVLLPDALERPDAVARFEREARAAAQLKTQHVVRVLDVDSDPARGGIPFIVMDYLEGCDLGAELRQRGRIPPAEAVDLVLEASFALAEAHACGIIHRDIKPSNLFLSAESGGRVLKVMDFGISKLLAVPGESDLTTTATTLGTPSHMAPEQLISSRAIDHRVDIWALGVVLFRMLSGTLPFTAENATALAVTIATKKPTDITTLALNIPPDLAAIVMQMLERDPNKRPADAGALARLLEPFGTGRVHVAGSLAARASRPALPQHEPTVTTAVAPPPVESAAKPKPTGLRSPILLALGLGLVLAIFTIMIVVVRNPPKADGLTVSATAVPSAPASITIPEASSAMTTPSLPPPPTGAPPTPVEPASAAAPRPLTKRPGGKPAGTSSAQASPTNDPLHL